MAKGKVVLLAIPAGAQAVRCDCGRLMFFIAHPSTGNRHPVRVQTGKEGHKLPTAKEAGAGESHFADCPNAAHHRRARRASHG